VKISTKGISHIIADLRELQAKNSKDKPIFGSTVTGWIWMVAVQ